MLSLPVFGALVALVAPYLVWLWHRRTEFVIYQGEATILHYGLLPKERSAVVDYDFLYVEAPGLPSLLLEVSKSRLHKLTGVRSQVEITITKRRYCRPQITAVHWPGEREPEKVSGHYRGIGPACVYFLLGVATLFMAETLHVLPGFDVHSQLWFGAAALALSGYVMGRYVNGVPTDPDAVGVNVLGVSLGTGLPAVLALTLICAVLTLWCFSARSFLVLFPGIHAALALGSLLALLQRLPRRIKQQ